jgi:putative pyruvate formate lyase activating enzyme
VFRFLAEDISGETYVNVMDQYRPAFRAERDPRMVRRLSAAEYSAAVAAARAAGLHHFL